MPNPTLIGDPQVDSCSGRRRPARRARLDRRPRGHRGASRAGRSRRPARRRAARAPRRAAPLAVRGLPSSGLAGRDHRSIHVVAACPPTGPRTVGDRGALDALRRTARRGTPRGGGRGGPDPGRCPGPRRVDMGCTARRDARGEWRHTATSRPPASHRRRARTRPPRPRPSPGRGWSTTRPSGGTGATETGAGRWSRVHRTPSTGRGRRSVAAA